jgi:hypothetical protein
METTKLPLYRSHKEVWAIKIERIKFEADGGAYLEGQGAAVKVDNAYMSKHNPQVGGYYVLYKGGYESWSPADAFEDGYSLV